MSCSLPPPPLSLAHWQGGTSEPHYCRRIYEAEPNGKEKASVNNCRELHSQLWNLIKYAVIRHKDQKHYSTPTESYGGTLISNRPTVQKKKKQTSSHTCPTHKPKETLPLPSEKNNSQHLRLIKYMKQEREKKSVETVLAVKREKEEAVKVEKDVSTGPDYKGLYSSQAFYHPCHQKQTLCHRWMTDGCQSWTASPSLQEAPAEIWPSSNRLDLAGKGLQALSPVPEILKNSALFCSSLEQSTERLVGVCLFSLQKLNVILLLSMLGLCIIWK